MPRRLPPNGDNAPRGGPRSRGIEKKSYMTRDASRRLRLAKTAARECLKGGGSVEQAAAAAQAYGTPAGDDSDGSEDSDEPEEEEEDHDQELSTAVEGQLSVSERSQTAASASADVDETARQALPKEASQDGEADASGSALPELT